MDNIDTYLNKLTLIVGDTNSGKTLRTTRILELFIAEGLADEIAVLDLAPDQVQRIGGKMALPPDVPLLYKTAGIFAPRLMGKDENHTERLAEENARTIEGLFSEVRQQEKSILFINDASLYLQAGDPERFTAFLETAETRIVNAYYGKTFADSSLSRRERKRIEDLMKQCDQLIS
jgi:hypothetical protein